MVKDTVDPPQEYVNQPAIKTRPAAGGTEVSIEGNAVFVPHPTDDPVSQRDVQCNLSALLLLVVEQQAMLAEMLSVFVDNGIISAPSLVKITQAKNNSKITTPIYEDLYTRFTDLFIRTKLYLLEEEEKAAADSPAENSANDEENKDE